MHSIGMSSRGARAADGFGKLSRKCQCAGRGGNPQGEHKNMGYLLDFQKAHPTLKEEHASSSERCGCGCRRV